MIDLTGESLPASDLPAFDPTGFSQSHASSTVGEKFLVFSIGEELFAVSSTRVAEATAPLAVTALPNSPEWLLGLANLRGEIISVIDSAKILRQPQSAAPKSKFIVVRSRIFEGGAAFVVDKINEIVSISGDAIQPIGSEKSPHVFGRTDYKSQKLNLIDTEKMLASLKI